MSMMNRTAFTPTQSLESLGIANKVDFSVSRGATTSRIGRNNKAVSFRQQKQCYTRFSISFPHLKPSEYQSLVDLVNTVQGSLTAFPFNDFSDNYVIPWLYKGVEQYGTVVRIAGTTDQFRPVKIYRAGKSIGIRPIYFFPPDATIELNQVEINEGSINRETGIITSATDISGQEFSTDLYYVPVRIVTPPTYNHLHTRGADFGLNSSVTMVNDVEGKQQLKASMVLEEVSFNEVLNQPLFPTQDFNNNLSEIDLNSYVRNFELGYEHTIPEWSQKGLSIRQDNDGVTPFRKLRIPGNVVKHKDLIYFLTLFRATCGGSFTITEL